MAPESKKGEAKKWGNLRPIQRRNNAKLSELIAIGARRVRCLMYDPTHKGSFGTDLFVSTPDIEREAGGRNAEGIEAEKKRRLEEERVRRIKMGTFRGLSLEYPVSNICRNLKRVI
jgi:hypothetical protein